MSTDKPAHYKTNKLAAIVLTVSIMLGINSVSLAQNATQNKPQDSKLLNQIQSSELELVSIQDKIIVSVSRKAELNKEIGLLDKDRSSINRNLIETSTRSRSLEESINRTANRLQQLRHEEDLVRGSLLSKKSVLIEVIATLQRMGHKPPPALLVRPEDALSSVRSAILLGAVIPEIHEQTQTLVSELNALVDIANNIDESRSKLTADLEGLAEQEERLTLLLEKKKQLSSIARQELAKQSTLAVELAGKAKNLTSLIDKLENTIDAVKQAAKTARLADQKRLRLKNENLANARTTTIKPDFSDTSRITPAMAFTAAKGLLPKPANGVEIASFGKKLSGGETALGISLATRANTRVQSPADGWIIYAGPFRSYGQLLILNAGDGYHVIMAGMEKIDVELGQFVLTGEPIGIMGTSRIASTGAVDIGSSQPVLYVEFRKDGKSIDPSPWWVTSSVKERNG